MVNRKIGEDAYYKLTLARAGKNWKTLPRRAAPDVPQGSRTRHRQR